ncbi:uncharacterized protein LOC132401028 [Hypanus sabinus]|uniref:uncharacterized protein LOC132401028 n=1 Tax=Hypanus sabinus TaxID=79690 RepID=UPI0028C4D52E|nr:uncharacterized protein LOC132401028 [Hypanus sabinus]
MTCSSATLWYSEMIVVGILLLSGFVMVKGSAEGYMLYNRVYYWPIIYSSGQMQSMKIRLAAEEVFTTFTEKSIWIPSDTMVIIDCVDEEGEIVVRIYEEQRQTFAKEMRSRSVDNRGQVTVIWRKDGNSKITVGSHVFLGPASGKKGFITRVQLHCECDGTVGLDSNQRKDHRLACAPGNSIPVALEPQDFPNTTCPSVESTTIDTTTIAVTTVTSPLLCDEIQTDTKGVGLVLEETEERIILVPGYRHVQVLFNLTSLQIPSWCGINLQELFQHLLIEQFTHSEFKTGKRRRRGLIEFMGLGYTAGVSTVNTLDIAEVNSQLNSLRQKMKEIVNRDFQDMGGVSTLGKQQANVVSEMLHILQPLGDMTNRIIDRVNNETTQHTKDAVCTTYTSWLLSVIGLNMVQLENHRVPDWISDEQLKEWVGTNTPGCHIREFTFTNHLLGNCRNGSGPLYVGAVLHIPYHSDNQTYPLYKVHNVGKYQDGVWISLANPPIYAIKWQGSAKGVNLASCHQKGEYWVCPEDLFNNGLTDCGFVSYDNCSLSILPVGNRTFIKFALVNDTYYFATSSTHYKKGSLTCSLYNHNVALSNVLRDLFLAGQVLPKPVVKPPIHLDIYINDTAEDLLRYVPTALPPIPHFTAQWDRVINHNEAIIKQWDELSKTIKDHADLANDILQDPPFWSKVWNWGRNVNVHPWIRIISHVVIVLLLVLMIIQCIFLSVFRRQLKQLKSLHAKSHSNSLSSNVV